MMHILLAIGTVVGVVALAIVCLRIREPDLASFSSLSLWSASRLETPEPPPKPDDEPAEEMAEEMAASPAEAAKPPPAASSVADRLEGLSERRVGMAARQMVAEVEEYLAGRANSR
jgi:hypothetical protein